MRERGLGVREGETGEQAARACRARSSGLPRSSTSSGSTSMMSRAASTAKLAETGLALTFQMLSSACDSASRPVASVSAARAAERQRRIDDRGFRIEPRIGERIFVAVGRIPDRRPGGDFAARSGRRRHRDDGREGRRVERRRLGQVTHDARRNRRRSRPAPWRHR